MSTDDVAQVAMTIASLAPYVNLLASIVLPARMPFVGRG